MAGTLPESYRRLAAFAQRFAAGSRLYDQGAVLDRFYAVLRGQVQFEVVSEGGDAEVVAVADPGDLVGHVAAFTARPTSASAHTASESILIAVPLDRTLEAFKRSPELALALVQAFADPQPARTVSEGADEAEMDGSVEGPPPPVDEEDGDVVRIGMEFDESFFFLDTAQCPVDGIRFEFLRVRTRSVRPASRDSDFFVRYQSADPTRYSVVVCPVCGYASYLDDFDALDEEARGVLWASREERGAILPERVNGLRSLDDAVRVLELGMRCYDARNANIRRKAVLLHRRAWIERERGNREAEVEWLRRARDAYRGAYEQDSKISEEAALRAAYLVGDLTLRLGDPHEASQWLETVTRAADPKTQSGIVRMARDLLHEARMVMRAERQAS